MDEYLEAARQDHVFLTVHVPDQHRVEEVHAVLVAHGAHLMHYYTAVGMADLPATIRRLPAGTPAQGDAAGTGAEQADASDSQRDLQA